MSQISLVRQERHAYWQKQQLCRKWAPVFIKLMHRRKSAAATIQRWIGRVLYKNAEDTEWTCDQDTPGIYRMRFSLNGDQICLQNMGVTASQWKDMDVVILPFAAVCDVRMMRFDGLISARGLMYRLSPGQLKRLVRAQKLTGNVKYIQDIEYCRSMAVDIKEGRLRQKN